MVIYHFPVIPKNIVNLVQCFNTEDILCSIEETLTMYIVKQSKLFAIHKIIKKVKRSKTFFRTTFFFQKGSTLCCYLEVD